MKVKSKLCKLAKQIGNKDVDQWLLEIQLEKLQNQYEAQGNEKYKDEANNVIAELKKQNMQSIRQDYIELDGYQEEVVSDEVVELRTREKELHNKERPTDADKQEHRIVQNKLRAYGVVIHEDMCKLGISTKEKPRKLAVGSGPLRVMHDVHSAIQKQLGEKIVWHEIS